jgi:hypothetical protein
MAQSHIGPWKSQRHACRHREGVRRDHHKQEYRIGGAERVRTQVRLADVCAGNYFADQSARRFKDRKAFLLKIEASRERVQTLARKRSRPDAEGSNARVWLHNKYPNVRLGI